MKNILITGCRQGLGKAFCESFIRRDCRVIPHYRTPQPQNQHTLSVVGDLDESSTLQNIEDVLYSEKIDVFINNAAIYSSDNFCNYSEEEIRKVFNTNLITQFLLLQKVYNFFKEQRCGIIINVNSLGCKNSSPHEALYGASKFGLNGFSKSLQLESIGTGVQILDLFLGAMKTQMAIGRTNFDNLIDPVEVAELVTTMIMVEPSSCYPNELVIRRS